MKRLNEKSNSRNQEFNQLKENLKILSSIDNRSRCRHKSADRVDLKFQKKKKCKDENNCSDLEKEHKEHLKTIWTRFYANKQIRE